MNSLSVEILDLARQVFFSVQVLNDRWAFSGVGSYYFLNAGVVLDNEGFKKQ